VDADYLASELDAQDLLELGQYQSYYARVTGPRRCRRGAAGYRNPRSR
jgi:hypothetical protein